MDIRINPDPQINVIELSQSQRCVVIDNFLVEPDKLVAHAQDHASDFVFPERAYPGGVLPLSSGFLQPMQAFIKRTMVSYFPVRRGGMSFSSQLCLTTLQPRDFTWIQRLCHTDPGMKSGKSNYAAILYLFNNPALGGTAFFNWKDEGYWREMTARQQQDPHAGLEELESKFQLFRDPPCYMSDSNEAAEKLGAVSARFNRCIFYSGGIPHGACVDQPELLTSNPRSGRLTLNVFIAATAQ